MLQNEIEPGVLALSLAVSAIEQGSISLVSQAALATLLQDLSEKGMVRSQELRLAAVQKKVPQSFSTFSSMSNSICEVYNNIQ
jgi:hypothetical protein